MAQLGIRFGSGAKPPPQTMKVRELVERAHRTVESAFGQVWVEGEIANLKLAPSGHAYFTLRDGEAALSCAMWRSSVQRLRFRLESGAQVRVFGRVGIYVSQGKFQMYAERAEPAGLGDLMARLEALKAKLAAEGLFATERKRPLPSSPRIIGVVTSPSGAAIHDICKVIRRRFPSRILLSPARVQGREAPAEIVAALERLARVEGVDVIIIGRGGGSLEDLWAFNDERLARAIAACPVPVISAVGHEVDVSVSDLVADVRAATPSQAGELVVRDQAALHGKLAQLKRTLALVLERRVLDVRRRFDDVSRRLHDEGDALQNDARVRLEGLERRLSRQGERLTSDARDKVRNLSRRLERRHPRAIVERDRHRLDKLMDRLVHAQRAELQRRRSDLRSAAAGLDAMSPLRVLERGYAVVRDDAGRAIRDAAELERDGRLQLRFARGSASARVESIELEADANSDETP